MNKFTFNQKLREILFVQDLGENKQIYKSFAGAGFTGGHPGIDLLWGDGDPVKALYDGVIVYIQPDTIVQLTDDDKDGKCLEINYAHCKDQKVVVGDRVKAGQIVGSQDSTGPSIMWEENDPNKVSWSHLHLGIRNAVRTTEKVEKNYFWNYQKFSSVNYKVIENDPTIEHFINPNDFNCRVLYLIAKCIERKEGMSSYFNNPGALRYSPFQSESKDGFAVFKDYETGFNALVYQLGLAVGGKSKYYQPTMTIYDFFKVYSPSSDNNDPLKYAKDVVDWVGLRSINDLISDWALTEIEWAKKYNSAKFLAYPEDAIQIDPSGKMSVILRIFKQIWNIVNKDKKKVDNL